MSTADFLAAIEAMWHRLLMVEAHTAMLRRERRELAAVTLEMLTEIRRLEAQEAI